MVEISETRKRLAELDDKARAKWLDAAEAEFCAYGFEQASFNRILATAGESKGRTYHYFAGKAELFRATLERRVERIGVIDEAAALPATKATEFWTAVAGLCDRLRFALADDAKFAELVRVLHREVAARDAYAEPLKTLERRIETLIAAGQSVGAIRTDMPLNLLSAIALNLAATIDRWFAEHGTDLPESDAVDLSKRSFDLLAAPFFPPTTDLK